MPDASCVRSYNTYRRPVRQFSMQIQIDGNLLVQRGMGHFCVQLWNVLVQTARLLYTMSRANGTEQFTGYWSALIRKEWATVSSRNSVFLVALLLLVASASACGV